METIYKNNAVAYVKYTVYGRLIPNSLTVGTSIPKDTNKTMYRQVPIYIDSQDFVNLPSVVICNKTWTNANLDVTTYRNGDVIPQVTDTTEWANLTTGAWCYPNNDPALGAIYGKFYNHYAVTDPRGLAPDGWHIPVVEEWLSLVPCTGGHGLINPGEMTYQFVGGTGPAIKEVGTAHWTSPNVATNSTGFTALGTGVRRGDDGYFDGGSFNIGNPYPELPPYWDTWFWSKEVYSSIPGFRVPTAVAFFTVSDGDIYQRGFLPETWGCSVRLIKDLI